MAQITSNTALPPKPPHLLDEVRAKLRFLHYSLRTEQSYVGWTKRFIFFHGKRHPKEMGRLVASLINATEKRLA